MSEPFDLVILGGGCAGLSLSRAVATHDGRCPRTLVIESRSEYTNDRTWCYWGDANTDLPYTVHYHWQTMRVTHAGQSVLLDCGLTPYQMLAANDFYASVQKSLDQHPKVTLQLGTVVTGEPSLHDNLWTITTNAGTVTARSIVDTRPSRKPCLDGAVLWQSFLGHEIECDTPVFDASTIDLMNFLDTDSRYVPFEYVLPMSSTRALVEVTVFGAIPLSPSELSARVDAAIANRVRGVRYKILRSEHGILPMGLSAVPTATHPSFVKVGLMAGAARPSTGYAFQRIQRWADECAYALANGRNPTVHQPDSWPLRTMDRIFLDVLRADPSRAGALFLSLFKGADPARIIRFLSGIGTVTDCLVVVAAMPVSPFVRAALALAVRRGRIGKLKRLV